MEPDICHIGDGMRKRDGGNSKSRRCFDGAVTVRQLGRPAKPCEQALAVFNACVEKSSEIPGADRIVIPIENDGELVRLYRYQRVQLRIVQCGGCAAGVA